MTEVAGYKRDDLSIDQQLALRTAAARLGEQFAGIYGPETIERFLHSSYDQFATGRRCRTSCRCWPNVSPVSG